MVVTISLDFDPDRLGLNRAVLLPLERTDVSLCAPNRGMIFTVNGILAGPLHIKVFDRRYVMRSQEMKRSQLYELTLVIRHIGDRSGNELWLYIVALGVSKTNF